MERHAADYDPAVLARLVAGRDRTEPEIAAAIVVRRKASDAFQLLFDSGWDFLALPCTTGVARPKAGHDATHRSQLLALNAPASLAGLGALAVPVPVGADGLTAGLQLVVRDTDALRAAVGWSATLG